MISDRLFNPDLSDKIVQPGSILATKLYIPPARPELVPRPQLSQRLDEGLQGKLILISAPAGFGKTTMVSAWLSERMSASREGRTQSVKDEKGNFHPSREAFILQPFKAAWLSLEKEDNDPARFLAYFIAALQQIAPEIGREAQRTFLSAQRPSPEAFLTALINELVAVPTNFVLILDDYHVIEARSIHDILTYLLDHLPSQMHLVICSRIDPPLPLSRLRARGQLAEIRSADLKFREAEAALFLNRVMGLSLAEDQIAALEARTEGWIAGLQLAALSMQGRQDVAGFVAAFTGNQRYILDYLVEEVLQGQPELIQQFLLETSILDRLNGSLCDVVTGQANSQALLERLERANLFIIPLDEARQWYRYHHLFADFLCHRLKVGDDDVGQQEGKRVAELHRRASAWYAAHHLTAKAIDHALAAGDFEPASRLIEQVAQDLLMRGQVITLHNWLEALPDELVRNRLPLCLAHAWTLLLVTAHLAATEQRLQEAEAALPAAGATAEMSGEITALRAIMAVARGDLAGAAQFSRQIQVFPVQENSFSRGVMVLVQGFLPILNGDVVEADQACAEMIRVGRETGNFLITMIAMSQQIDLQVVRGHLHQAAQTCRQMMQMAADDEDQPLPIAIIVYPGLSQVLYEWNELETAASHLLEGITLSRQWGDVAALDQYLALARVRQAQGDTAGAWAAIQQVESFTQRVALDDMMLNICRAWLEVKQGHPDRAARWMKPYESPEARAALPVYPVRDRVELIMARIMMAQGRPGEALAGLVSLAQEAQKMGRVSRLIEALALQAVVYQTQGDPEPGLAALAQALALAEPAGYVRTFIDAGAPLAELLAILKVQQPAAGQAYVDKLLSAFTAEKCLNTPAAPAPGSAFWPGPASPTPALVEPLSERELEVLRLIAAGLSNQAIAQVLTVTVHTVKTHTKHIFNKLDVQSRTQAVARARALDLL